MSSFLCILDRSGAPLAPRDLDRLAEPLAIRGASVTTLHRGPVGIAVGRLDDEGVDRHGPAADPRTGAVIAVAGRFEAVDGSRSPAARDPLRTAALAVAGPEEDLGLLAGVAGSFVLVSADPAAGWVRIVRDHLGDLPVYYHLGPRHLVAASDPAVLLRHPAVSGALDEGTAARFLGFRFGSTGRSFFRDVRELAPAHRLHVGRSEERVDRYWRFPRPDEAAIPPPNEAAAMLRQLLRRSVERETAGVPPERVALSLSGGLDSTAIAAVAPPGVRAFSWSFDETGLGDESESVDAVARRLGLPLRRVRGDGLYPFAGGLDDFARRFVHPGSPYVNPFAPLKERLYAAAREAGCRRVLVGDGGDALYAAGDFWLRDALLGGRAGALGDLAGVLARSARGDRSARRVLGRLPPLHLVPSRLRRPPTWLTRAGRDALPEISPSPILPAGAGRAVRERYELVAGARNSELESEERGLFARCGVERANPFRSWPLLAATIALPAYLFRAGGRDKLLTREAFRGVLPERVIDGGRTGLLGNLFLRGVELARGDLREAVFERPVSDWRRWVRPEWVEPFLAGPGAAPRPIAFGHTILWRVISYELWHRRLAGRTDRG